MINRKILWKIEELWKIYSDIYSSKEYKRNEHRNISLVQNYKNELRKLYKNDISVYNPDFYFVEEFNFELSKKSIYRDRYGKYFGLKNSQVLEKNGKLIYLFDNHNKIIQSFLEYIEITGMSFDVVHIDAHDDDAVFPKEKPHKLELTKVQKYIEQTRISDFFDFLNNSSFCRSEPVSEPKESNKIKLIQNIHRYTKSTDFKEFKKPQNPYILSLDIDIFGPEGDFVDLESKIRVIAKAWQYADVICIVTSPGFIGQDFTEEIIKIFTKNLT